MTSTDDGSPFTLTGAATAAPAARNRELVSSHGVDNHGAVDAMSVPRLLAEEGWRGVIGPHRNESIVAAHAPAAVTRVPLETAADIARQERISAVDAEIGSLEHCQAADPAGDVGDDRLPRRRRHDEVARVVQLIGPLLIASESSELKILRNAERACDFAFDPEDPVDVVGEGAAQVVVAEAWTPVAGCVKRAAARNDADFDGARARRRLLRECATSPCDR